MIIGAEYSHNHADRKFNFGKFSPTRIFIQLVFNASNSEVFGGQIFLDSLEFTGQFGLSLAGYISTLSKVPEASGSHFHYFLWYISSQLEQMRH